MMEGQGTTFTVTFPQRIKASVAVEAKADGREEAQAATGAVHEETERAGKNVLLLAEDDADMAMGPRGAYLANRNAGAYAVCPAVTPVDTTGAGDIFGGSAVSRLLKIGKKPEELDENELFSIGRFACTAASLSTMRQGGIPSIPEEQEVLEQM